MEYELLGIAGVEEALEDLGKTAKPTARRALKKSGEPMRAEWERLAPEDDGELKRSIKIGRAIRSEHRKGNRGERVTEFIGIDESLNRRLHIYAEVQEFGNANNAAQPAGRPAFESKQTEVLTVLQRELWAEIKKTAERAARKQARLALKVKG